MKEGIRRDQYRVIAISSSIVSETLFVYGFYEGQSSLDWIFS